MNQGFPSRKEQAIKLRLLGQSYRAISDQLNVARSTLNGWLKDIKLTPNQQQQLLTQWRNGLRRGRIQATKSHIMIKQNKILTSHIDAKKFLSSMNLSKPELELFLAGLYLGDGFKIDNRLGLGNANPDIVLLFLSLLRKLYHIEETRLRAAIFGRHDQNPDSLIKYWSNLLDISPNQFHKTQLDHRTKNKVSRIDYHGVCAVEYHDTNIQRRILAIGHEMIKYVNQPTKRGL